MALLLVYCLLVNRVQFLREHSYQVHHQTVNTTRALLCELAATRILRRFEEDKKGSAGLLFLASILVAGFNPFQGAPEDVIQENIHALEWMVQKRGGYEKQLTALEVAIVSESKLFLASPAAQKVVDAIYKGRIIYTPTSFIDILPDHYKHKPITLYDPKRAPLLDQYRLVVPRTRNILEVCQFVTLLALYVLVMHNRDPDTFTAYERVFCVYAFGWILDQLASMLEHGWQVYTQNLWSFLDVTFGIIYGVYFCLRMHGLVTGNFRSNQQALDVLSTAAPVLIPRLAFNVMSENMLFISLRAMMADFTMLTFLAVWCFAGFLLAMKWLSGGSHQPITISKWMLWVWFGLDGTGIQRSIEFHWLLGPFLMVTFAFLGNTLFLTILVSMLSNTFSLIVSNATAEIQFRRAVLIFEGVKSDAIFAYQPPSNILALCILLPLKFAVSPRWFHKINVAVVRTLNAPLLLVIGIYERSSLWALDYSNVHRPRRPRGRLALWGLSRFYAHGDIQAVFDCDPPESILDESLEEESVSQCLLDNDLAVTNKNGRNMLLPDVKDGRKTRKASMDSIMGFAEHIPGILQQYSGGNNTQDRLEALEESTKRIEDMLRRLCQTVDKNASREGAEQ